MELEGTFVCQTFHGADHLANSEQFVTAAVHIMVEKLTNAGVLLFSDYKARLKSLKSLKS